MIIALELALTTLAYTGVALPLMLGDWLREKLERQ